MGEGTIRPPARSRKGGRMGEPKPTERPTEPIDRKFGLPLPPVGAWLEVEPASESEPAPRGESRRPR